MVKSGHLADEPPLEVGYAPQGRHRLLPVEVVDRAELIERIAGRELNSRQRADFHQLVVCTSGAGTHYVDFEPVAFSVGTVLRIYPGQVQRFIPDPRFEAAMVVWPVESHHHDPDGRMWYPGSDTPTRWQVEGALFDRVLFWVNDLRSEQDRFDGSTRHIQLMRAILCALLLRLAVDLPGTSSSAEALPAPYVEFREAIEERLYQRPTVVDLAQSLGYSSRTLDRACQQVTGQTARQVFDDRVALEIRRLLTHTTRPLFSIASDLGFSDQSNFTRFVKRHLGRPPGDVRSNPLGEDR